MADVLTTGQSLAGSRDRLAGALGALRQELAAEAPELVARLEPLIGEGAGGQIGPAPRGSPAIPHVDYDRHPYYRALDCGDEALRQAAADRFFETFGAILGAERALADRREAGAAAGSGDLQHREAVGEMERDGIHRFRLRPSELAEILERSQPAAEALEARRQRIAPDQRAVGATLQPLASRTAKDEAFEFYDELLRAHGVHAIAEQYYGCPFKLLGVNLQANTGEDTGIARVCSFPDGRRSPAYYLHVDSAPGVLKVLMYRSPKVTAANGAFRYMPGSHKALGPVERAVRKTIDKAGFEPLGDDGRRLFMALPACLRHKANFGNDLLPEAGFDTDVLLAREMVFEGEAGEAVLVDINGAHRGNIHTDPVGRREMFKFVLKAGK